jgi:hypothetical protein
MDKCISQLYELIGENPLTLGEIALVLDLSYSTVFRYVKRTYSKEIRDMRKKLCYSYSKLGGKNPMTGKYSELHHNYKGIISDGKGYLMALKPDWYTGRKGCKHVFVHHLVICKALGLTEIPAGFCVHHIDKDPTNNDLSNLQLMTLAAHTRLHTVKKVQRLGESRRDLVNPEARNKDLDNESGL